MAVTLGIELEQNSQSIDTLSTNVTIKLKAFYTEKSHNTTNPPGSITIDGTKYSFNSSFNVNIVSSGYKTLYSKTLDITHDPNNGKKELKCSATFNTEVSSGVITAEQTFTLDRFYFIYYNKNGLLWNVFPSAKGIKLTDKTFTLDTTNPGTEIRIGDTTPFTITGNANGGDENTLCIASSTPKNEYIFTEWNTAKDGTGTSYKPGGKYTDNSPVTLYANYKTIKNIEYSDNALANLPIPTRKDTVIERIVTFNKGGGTMSADDSAVSIETVKHTFREWTQNKDGSGTVYTDEDTFTSSTIVYAQWDNTSSVTPIELPDISRVGYIFNGWSTTKSVDDIVVGQYIPTDNTTLYALWESADNTPYTVNHYIQNIDDDIFNLHHTITNYGNTDEVISISDLTESITGFTFYRGKVNDAVAFNATIRGDGSSVINMYYTRNSYSVTINPDDDRIVVVSGDGTYKYDEYVDIVVKAPDNYHISEWIVNGNSNIIGDTMRFKMPASDMLLIPKIEINRYTIVFDGNGAENIDSVSIEPMHLLYDSVDSLHPNVYTRVGYNFIGWNTAADGSLVSYDDGATVNALTNVHQSTITLYAQWEKIKYGVTYNTNKGSDGPPDDIKIYGEDYIISNIIPIRVGYDFIGWSSDPTKTVAEYNAGATYSANESITLYAIWQLKVFSNTVRHLMTGFLNNEGTVNDNKHFELQVDVLVAEYAESISLINNTDITLYNIPNGFTISNVITIISEVTYSGSLDEELIQPEHEIEIWIFYEPIDYDIVYDPKGGIIDDTSPTSYNVLYPVELKGAEKKNNKFIHWINENGEPIYAINFGVDTSFPNLNTLYNDLATRTTGTINLTAKWKPIISIGNIYINGTIVEFECYVYSDGKWHGLLVNIVNDGEWKNY